MDSIKWETFMSLFRILCIIITSGIIVFVVHDYSLNDDLCLVDYSQFRATKEDKYPTLSTCFKNIFYSPYLLANGVNESSYLAYLKGEYFDSNMLNIDFERATLNFTEYISDDFVYWKNETGNHSTIVNKNEFTNTFNGFWRNGFYKCYGINTPYNDQYLFTSVLLDGNIFPTAINQSFRPSGGNYLLTFFHYPGQLLNSIKNVKYI